LVGRPLGTYNLGNLHSLREFGAGYAGVMKESGEFALTLTVDGALPNVSSTIIQMRAGNTKRYYTELFGEAVDLRHGGHASPLRALGANTDNPIGMGFTITPNNAGSFYVGFASNHINRKQGFGVLAKFGLGRRIEDRLSLGTAPRWASYIVRYQSVLHPGRQESVLSGLRSAYPDFSFSRQPNRYGLSTRVYH
jgi:hypothetical protein